MGDALPTKRFVKMIQNKQKYFQKYVRINLDYVQVELSLVLIYLFVSVVHQETINPLGGVMVLWFCLALCHVPCVSFISDRSWERRVEGTWPLCTPMLKNQLFLSLDFSGFLHC